MAMTMTDINPCAYVNRDDEEEKRIMHYKGSQQILIVGDGDFSFSLCLAKAFGSANNLVATSLDSFSILNKKYKQALSNLVNLKLLGAHVLHGVDANKMRLHTDLQMRKFDRIIFNFPHAGFFGKEDSKNIIKKHQKIIKGFFKNASGMLRPYGEIHVSHKTKAPFCHWNIEELAKQSSLFLKETLDFNIKDYPTYNNKRGHGSRSDEPFPLGKCSTYVFILSSLAKSFSNTSQSSLIIPATLPIETQMPYTGYVENRPLGTFLIENERFRIFAEYVNHVITPFGRPDFVHYSIRELLRLGYERYMREVPERGLDGYIRLLHELQMFHISRMAKLTEMLNFGCELVATRNLDFYHNTMAI